MSSEKTNGAKLINYFWMSPIPGTSRYCHPSCDERHQACISSFFLFFDNVVSAKIK
jgi:hypothetical protein